MTGDTALLSIRGLRVRLPAEETFTEVIRGVDLDVHRGELVGIAGESGSGKSLTALSILGLLPRGADVSGSVLLGGDQLVGLSDKRMEAVRGGRIGIVFQDSAAALHPMLSIGRQLTEHVRQDSGVSKREARRQAAELLDQVRIPHPERALDAYPHQFSGGMRQRVAIAIALARDPELLIADEPTTALDVTVQAGILRLLDRLARERHLAVLFITHDLGVLASLTDRCYVFYAGRVMEEGPTSALLGEPRHPYTNALLHARPHGIGQRGTLHPIPGVPAVAGELTPGCAFAPRCRFAEPRCTEAVPDQVEVAPGHTCACVVLPDMAGAGSGGAHG